MTKKTTFIFITFFLCFSLFAKPLNYKTLAEETLETTPAYSFLDSNLNNFLYGPEWYNSFNTASPYGQNDGALWQGRGYNTSLSSGFSLDTFGFSLTVKPVITFSQNLPYKIKESCTENPYGYFWWWTLDKPQRFGDKCFFTFDFGESEIRYSWRTLSLGFGTQSPWIGPAFLNPLIHSNNAPSYPKFDIGLRKQEVVIPGLNWNLGFIEGRIWLGQLSESDYYDSNETNDKTLLTGFNASWAPSFLPGFTLGLNKICLTAWTRNFIKYLNPFYSTNNWEFPEDQKMSITMDLVLPDSGFELFSEIGMDDYTSSFITNPGHTLVWTLGFSHKQDFIKDNDITSEIIFEMNNLEMSQDFQLQWGYGGYYTHGGVLHGYTNKGQVIGNGSTIGGNSQFMGYKLYAPCWEALLFLHRFCPDNNYNYNQAVYDTALNGNLLDYYATFETHLAFGGNFDWLGFDHIALSGGTAIELTYCPQYRATSDYILNFHFNTGVKYRF